jgi:hypothetical protein
MPIRRTRNAETPTPGRPFGGERVSNRADETFFQSASNDLTIFPIMSIIKEFIFLYILFYPASESKTKYMFSLGQNRESNPWF